MDNADLEKLKVSAGKLIPRFKASVTDYAVTVGSGTLELKLTILTSDSGASYVIKGTEEGGKTVELEEGELVEVKVVVSAEDGTTTKTYSLKVARLCADDAKLSQLEVTAGTLTPSFSPLVHNYDCSLTCQVDTLTMHAKTEEEAMKISLMDGSPVGMIKLNPGRTVCVLQVESASGKKKTEYIIVFNKTPLPPTLQLKNPNDRFECAVCCCVVSMSSRIDEGPFVYCKNCLEELTRTNKTDPFTGKKLEGGGWMKLDFKRDGDLGNEEAVCSLPLPIGKVEKPMNQIGSKLMVERLKAAGIEDPSEGCKACSKKIPRSDMTLHKELLCVAAYPITLKEKEVKARTWEKRLVDETSGLSVDELVKGAVRSEEKYLRSLPQPGEATKAPLDHLMAACGAYATAIQSSPKEGQNHIALGLVLEELFYAEDLFGITMQEPLESQNEAQTSSNEEEFFAISKIHGVPPSAPVALHLKAVEAEYQTLKESGQTHKADHVQALFAWKSKKILEADQSAYAVDKESPLYKAKVKYQDAVSINPSDGLACYHLGRVCLLLGEREMAKEYLVPAVALKPTLSPARFCLGLALPAASKVHAKSLLLQGLSQYLAEHQAHYETNPEPHKRRLKQLHANKFYHSANTLIFEGFLELSSYSGHAYLTTESCLLSATSCVARAHLQHRASTYQRLLWLSLKGRAILLHLLHRQGGNNRAATLRHCRQLSALISCSALESSPLLREMQMEVFQLGVLLQPSNSEALCHLGNGQLSQYEATEEEIWLKDAELSFRASIDMERKPIAGSSIPDKLAEEEWWMKTHGKTPSPLTAAAKKPTPASGKQVPPATKQPLSTEPAGRSKSSTTASRAPSSARVPPSTSGAPRASAGTGRGGATKVASKSISGPTPSKPGPTPSKPGPAVSKTASTSRPVASKTASTSGPVAAKTTTGPRLSVTSRGGKTVVTLGELRTGAGDGSASKSKERVTSAGKVRTSGDGKERVISAGKVRTSGDGKERVVSAGKARTSGDGKGKEKGEPSSSQEEDKLEQQELNKPSYLPRLGLARTLAKTHDTKKQLESLKLYKEVMKMSPFFHDAYIELGEILAKTNPASAVEVYARFPFKNPPTFDDAYLHGEIIRLVMKSGNYDNPRLVSSMIAMGKALGIGVLDKQVAILEGKFKSAILKKVYAGVHGKSEDDPELQAFFKFKCWL